jgi:hypothetical protein
MVKNFVWQFRPLCYYMAGLTLLVHGRAHIVSSLHGRGSKFEVVLLLHWCLLSVHITLHLHYLTWAVRRVPDKREVENQKETVRTSQKREVKYNVNCRMSKGARERKCFQFASESREWRGTWNVRGQNVPNSWACNGKRPVSSVDQRYAGTTELNSWSRSQTTMSRWRKWTV